MSGRIENGFSKGFLYSGFHDASFLLPVQELSILSMRLYNLFTEGCILWLWGGSLGLWSVKVCVAYASVLR